MDAERLVKISRDDIPDGRKYPGRPKRRWSDLILASNRRNHKQQEEEHEDEEEGSNPVEVNQFFRT